MKSYHFNLIFIPEPEGGYTVSVPALPGCITYGKTLEKARKMADEAISLHVECMQEDGEEIPSDNMAMLSSIDVTLPALHTQ